MDLKEPDYNPPNCKKIEIIRFGQWEKVTTDQNGERFDSTIKIFQDSGCGPDFIPQNPFITNISNVNTDPTGNYRGGIAAEDIFGGIVAPPNDVFSSNHIRIFSLHFWDEVKKYTDITAENSMVKSLISNPNQGGRDEMDFLMIHVAGFSAGCITIKPYDWCHFIKYFPTVNEKMVIELKRQDIPALASWPLIPKYQGK